MKNPQSHKRGWSQTRLVKKLVRKRICLLSVRPVDTSVQDQYKERELNMSLSDKLVSETEDRKNALEVYTYDMRDKLDDIYAPFVSDEEKSMFSSLLDDA